MNPENLNISGEELKRLRSLRGIKQRVIAKYLHITQQAYSKLERRQKISDTSLDKVLKVLNYTSEDISKLKNYINTRYSQN